MVQVGITEAGITRILPPGFITGGSIGGLLQFHQVSELCDDGVGRYDLGTEMDYKRRWAEEIVETEMLVLVR